MNQQKKTNQGYQKRAASLKRSVCQELRWTDLEYANYQYEQGHAYLMEYLQRDAYCVRVMERSRIFWNWWKNHWTNRDEGFMEFVNNTTYSVAEMRDFYSDVHDAPTLAACIYPNGVVLNESYANMITELVHEEVEK